MSNVSLCAYRTAHIIASHHSHGWTASLDSDRIAILEQRIAAGATVLDLHTLTEQWMQGDPGITFGLAERTGSGRGRLSWTIDAATGDTTITVHRPCAAWCRWSALTSASRANRLAPKDAETLRAAAGPEPEVGDREVLRITWRGDMLGDRPTPAGFAVEVLDAAAIAARHIDTVALLLQRFGLGGELRSALAANNDLQLDLEAAGWTTDVHRESSTVTLLHWGTVGAMVQLDGDGGRDIQVMRWISDDAIALLVQAAETIGAGPLALSESLQRGRQRSS